MPRSATSMAAYVYLFDYFVPLELLAEDWEYLTSHLFVETRGVLHTYLNIMIASLQGLQYSGGKTPSWEPFNRDRDGVSSFTNQSGKFKVPQETQVQPQILKFGQKNPSPTKELKSSHRNQVPPKQSGTWCSNNNHIHRLITNY